jgi:predicted AlkP superfamily pyrophosphatase or phosphodiesterase
MMRRQWFITAICFRLCALAVYAQRTPVLLVSIDGLRPDYVVDAGAQGLKIPNLKRMVADGTYASGVRGVLPTVTYPSHATLVTGVSPSRHGICANTTFDPDGRNQNGWYWYASDIREPTLWEEAHKRGLITANVHWPVTVGAKIDFNLPQIWRSGTADDRKLLRELATPGLLDLLERDLPPYADGADESLAADQRRTAYAVRILQLKRPAFMTFYLASLDHVEHEYGPHTKEANSTLEEIDKLIGNLRRAAGDEMVMAVVSDHGFLPVTKEVNLLTRFREAGLIDAQDYTHVKSWNAAEWASGASSAVIVNSKAPPETKRRTMAVLEKTVKDPDAGVARILDSNEIQRLGGCPADFWVELKPDFTFGPQATGPLVTDSKTRGMHGFLADRREMNAVFFVAGPGIARSKSLGEIDMRDIAPTLAAVLGIKLEAAEGHNLFAHRESTK